MIKFSFHETDGLERKSEPVRVGVKLRRGAVSSCALLAVRDMCDGTIVPSHISKASTLSERFAGWILLDFVVCVRPYEIRDYELFVIDSSAQSENITLSPTSSSEENALAPVSMACGSIQLSDNGAEFLRFGSQPLNHVTSAHSQFEFSASLRLTDDKGIRHQARIIKCLPSDITNSIRKPYTFELECSSLTALERYLINLEVVLYPHSGLIEVELTIHNPAAAEHRGGLWDLGDPNSFYFQEIGLHITAFKATNSGMEVFSEGELQWYGSETGLKLSQCSSGGKNRRSSVHVDASGDVTVPDLGFELHSIHSLGSSTHANGTNEQLGHKEPESAKTPIAVGDRATPCAYIYSGNKEHAVGMLLAVHPVSFWQEFPNTLSVGHTGSSVSFFAGEANNELQPGERKRRKVLLCVSPAESRQLWITRRLVPLAVHGQEALAQELFLRPLKLESAFDQSLSHLIASPEEFFAKREVIDEYGWRHFGEVFADHESLYQTVETPPLVSHYNNQYDLVLGFGLQYLRSGDQRWFELMNDLARHVVDIDIYHTDEDKIEFNNGLFWHTNHYVDAATATHRTYSCNNFNHKQPIGCSGGPGIEHCYTTGLLLHYSLTGDEASAEAVLSLAQWALAFHEGDNTVLATLRSIWREDVSLMLAIVKGVRANAYTNPLTRSTGNLIVTMLDAFSLTSDRTWIFTAEKILLTTFAADDDINARDLQDIERNWSYTVFLQAVLRYLDVKQSHQDLDEKYFRVLHAFQAYAKWMLEHERPYLDTPEQLEFPNDTWAAQDLRKQSLLIAAAALDPDHAKEYKSKAAIFEQHILDRLGNSSTLSYARIQALILWNIGLASAFRKCSLHEVHSSSVNSTKSWVIAQHTRPSVVGIGTRAIIKLARALRTLRLTSELRWLRQRR